MAHQESVRRAYLAAMGISPWYARIPVAGGALSYWPETLEPDASSGSPAALVPALPKEAEARVAPAAPAIEEPRPEVRSSAPSDLPTPADTTLKASDSQRNISLSRQTGIEFQQQWWARDGWLIVDTRPKHMPVTQAQAADKLLHAIGFVLTGEARATFNQWIDWPLFVNRSIKHDLEEAQFYLAQKWQAAQHTGVTRKLLLLGELSAELLACLPENGADTRKPWQWGDVSCLSGPSSSELLHLPGLKKAFWQRLEPWMNS